MVELGASLLLLLITLPYISCLRSNGTSYRVITDGYGFKVQTRSWYSLIWRIVRQSEDLDNKNFGGDRGFDSFAEADAYINRNRPKVWRQVWKQPK